MRGILYGVGVGPGDPELMTLKAVRLIKENDIIAVPGAEVRETVAYKIAVQAVPELADKELLPIYMPMTHDKAELELNHEKGAKALEAALDTGKNVVFLTLGDPTIYSTFSYVQKRVEADGYETRLVSGITSFCATAARLNIPLTEWNQPLHVQPAVHRLDSELDQPGTYVLMKSGRKMNQVKEILERSGREVRMVENCGMPDELYLRSDNGEQISLAGEWKYQIAADARKEGMFPKDMSEDPNLPTSLYNAMIHPLVPYSIRGAIWYQGENNASRAYQYRELFPLVIENWRKDWGQDFPFYFVQLANFMQVSPNPVDSDWAELREAQARTLSVANTGMAVIIDKGDANDIHPKDKQAVGHRLALVARANTYGEQIPYSGPVYRSYQVDGDKIILSFDHTDGGLKSSDGKALQGFAIAGRDHKFHWAKAEIQGDKIVVSSPEVSYPVAVRYAWANNPVCNLYNGAGLPASPFRTDDWKGGTQK